MLLVIAIYKSQYYKKVLQKLDIVEALPTDMSDFQKTFSNKKVINLGYPGDTMKGMMLRRAMLKAVKPEKIFMMAGINGLKTIGINQFAAEYETLVNSVQTSLPHSQFYLQSILPIMLMYMINMEIMIGLCLPTTSSSKLQ